MHAQLFNPAMKSVGPVRKALQVRTIFNLLGPLVNPCLPAYQLLGVADLPQMRLYTNVFQKLGIGFAVVNNLDGYDEISLTDEFKVMTIATKPSTSHPNWFLPCQTRRALWWEHSRRSVKNLQ